jgi:hypothetical protein
LEAAKHKVAVAKHVETAMQWKIVLFSSISVHLNMNHEYPYGSPEQLSVMSTKFSSLIERVLKTGNEGWIATLGESVDAVIERILFSRGRITTSNNEQRQVSVSLIQVKALLAAETQDFKFPEEWKNRVSACFIANTYSSACGMLTC